MIPPQKILDFSQDLDIGLLDRVVGAMFTGTGPDVSTQRDRLSDVAIDSFFLFDNLAKDGGTGLASISRASRCLAACACYTAAVKQYSNEGE